MLLRLILSIYLFEKSKEADRFFDAWWQFTYTLEYLIFGLIIILCNLIGGVIGSPIDIKFYVVIIAFLFVFNILFSRLIRQKLEELTIEKSKKIKPYSNKILYTVAFFGVLLMIASFKFR